MARRIIAARVGAGGALALLVGLGTAAAALADPGPTADDVAAVLTGYGLVSSDFTGSTTVLDAATALAGNTQTDVFGGDVTASEVTNVFISDGIVNQPTRQALYYDSPLIAYDLNHVIPSGDEIQSVLSTDGVTSSDFSGDTTVGEVANALAAYQGILTAGTDRGTDIFGGSVSASQVTAALGIDGYQFASGSDLNAADIATDLNGATPPPGATNIPTDYTFADGNPDTAAENGTPVDDQGYSALFGAEGSVGAHNATLDAALFQTDPADAANFYNAVTYYEENNDHPLTDLIYSFDHNAFSSATFDGIDGAFLQPGGGYLIPTDSLGYLATEIDFVLNGNGLSSILDSNVDLLAAGAADMDLSI